MCKSIGRGPNSHPPGNVNFARPVLAIRAPKKIIEERIFRINFSGISFLEICELSTIIVEPSNFVLQPR